MTSAAPANKPTVGYRVQLFHIFVLSFFLLLCFWSRLSLLQVSNSKCHSFCVYRFGNGDISTVQCHCFYVYCAGLIYLKYTYLPSHKIGLGTLTKHQILANRRYQIYSQAYILPEAEEEEAAKNTTNFMSLKLVTCLCVYKYFRVFLTNFAFFYLLLSF